jgi:iron complex transport system ATP-binding protein
LAEPVLELRDATVVKNDRRILDSLTLTIHSGEHTAIIGSSGSSPPIFTTASSSATTRGA